MRERIAIFGATGGTGKRLIRQALDRGYAVTAFVRDPAKLGIDDDNLQVAQGDFLDADAVAAALAGGIDAVVCAAGIYQREYRTDLSDGTRNIVDAMQKHGIRRLLVVSSIGAGDSKGQGAWWVRAYYKLMLKYVIWDKDRQEQLIRDSGLDWTIVRPPRLFDRDEINPDVVVWSGSQPQRKLGWGATRPTLAKVVLDALAENRHVGVAVNISDPKG